MTTGREDDFDVLPDTTSDEDGEGWGDDVDVASDDDRLADELPPHWEES